MSDRTVPAGLGRRPTAPPRRPAAPPAAAPLERSAAAARAVRPSGARPATGRSRTRETGRPTAPGRRPGSTRHRPRQGRLRLGRVDGRLSVAVMALLVVMSLFVGRLFQLQILDGSAYANAALQDRLRPVRLPATRGEITDDTGAAFATTVAAYDITADPTVAAPHARELAGVLAVPVGMSVARLTALLTGNGHSQYVMLARQVSPARRDQIDAAIAGLQSRVAAADRHAAPVGGVFAQPDPQRVYPSGDVAGNVLGFVGSDGAGLAGLEYDRNRALAGKDGKSRREYAYGHAIPSGVDHTIPAVQGQSMQLTIDRDLQYYAQTQVSAAVAASRAQFGMAVVLDVRTMQVKAMVTTPTVDPAAPLKVPAGSRGNANLDFVYEPGSVEKLLTMATLFDRGLAGPTTAVTVPPTLTVGGVTIHDDVAHGTWHLTAAGVVARSSNIGAAQLSSRLPAATLHQYLASFGYGSKTGTGVDAGESAGILPALRDWKPYTKPEIAYGQSVSVTSLQVAAAVASLFNGGVYRAPTVVAGTIGPGGVLVPAAAAPAHRVVGARAAAEVVNVMQQVTQPGGTAPGAAIPGYVVAGKTGTAQYAENGAYHGYTTSFIGAAPADRPRYLVYVVIQKPRLGQTGVSTAMPAWRQIMTYLLTTGHLAPTGARPVRLPLTTTPGG